MSAIERYTEHARQSLTVYKPATREDAIWLHPGEPVFDALSIAVLGRFSRDGLRGAVFIDPYATEPYLFHVARVTVEQHDRADSEPDLWSVLPDGESARKTLESRLIGLRQSNDGVVEECPVEHLLLLRGARDFAPSRVPLATLARGMVDDAITHAREVVVDRLVQSHRQRRIEDLSARIDFTRRGFDFRAAELTAARARLGEKARAGDQHASAEFARVKERQRDLTTQRSHTLATLEAEPDLIQAGEVEFLAHALVVPVQDSHEMERYDADVETVAVQVATAYEERFDAEVADVSRPELARRAGLTDWPGFDLRSRRPGEERAIEVKGPGSHR